MNELLIQLITPFATVALVIITWKYAQLTESILEQSQKDQKIKLIEKKLENLYYPLQYVLYSYKIWLISEGSDPSRPKEWNEFDEKYRKIDTNKYDFEDIIAYRYLATKELEDYLDVFYEDYGTHKLDGRIEDVHKFRNSIDKFKGIVKKDIKLLKKEHYEIMYS